MYGIASVYELSAVIELAPMTSRIALYPARLAIMLLGIAFLENPATASPRAAPASAPSQSTVFLAFQCPNMGYGIACAPQYHAVSGGTDANGCSLPPQCVPNTAVPQPNRHPHRLRPRHQQEP